MPYNKIPTTEEEKELWFRSEMNKRQFKALAHRLVNSDIENEIINNSYYLRVRQSNNFDENDIKQWLNNSWNTETILFQNKVIIENTEQSFCMQWAFPQAYYAVFGNIIALFKAIGFTEMSHTAVLKKYSTTMVENKFPETISICCLGIEQNLSYHNINLPENIQNFSPLDLNSQESIDYYICQFLRATRKLRLKEKASKITFRTKAGTKRKSLNKDNWLQVSRTLGNTSIIDFLYRKRIKGNYQDIKTYSSPYFDGKSVLSNLIDVVNRINLVNETYLSKAIGYENFENIAKEHLRKVNNESLRNRINTIYKLENA